MSSTETNAVNPQSTNRIMLTLKETGAALGLGQSSIYKLVQAGEIPHRKFGRAIRVPRAWVESQGITAAAQE